MAARLTNLQIHGKGLDTGIKLPKLVEKSNKLISGIRGNFTAAESLIMCHGEPNKCPEAVLGNTWGFATNTF